MMVMGGFGVALLKLIDWEIVGYNGINIYTENFTTIYFRNNFSFFIRRRVFFHVV